MMHFIHRYFGILLLVSCMIGMFVPSVGEYTSLIFIISLASIIFCSYFNINLSLSSLTADFKISIQFYLLRFIILPIAVYFIFRLISDFYALVMLLIFLLPAAVSSPAFTTLFGGKPELSLKILISSSFLSIISIPFLMGLLPGSSVDIPAGNMLLTLIYTILIPFIVHLPLRYIKAVSNTIIRFNTLFTLLGLSIIFVFAIAKNKTVILNNPVLVGIIATEALVLYIILYLLGYFLIPKSSPQHRRTFAISSGANNIGLGVTITALFFPGNINIFFIVSQLAWVVVLIPVRHWMVKSSSQSLF
jgi:predicted Na+-dependent transporter